MPGKIFPGPVSGTVFAPASKSFMQRAVACALLCGSETRIHNPSLSADGKAALGLAAGLGADVEVKDKIVVIRPGAHGLEHLLNAGESGLSLRLFTPIAALRAEQLEIGATGSLLRRPVGMMRAPLHRLGVDFSSTDGFPPVQVRGPLKGGQVQVDASVTSQFLSGLLIALPVCEGESEILVSRMTSRPYVDMTLQVLERFDIHWQVVEGEPLLFRVSGGTSFHCPDFTVPGDWSGAAGLLVAGALAGSVTVNGLPDDLLQGDRAILDVLKEAGAMVLVAGESVSVSKKHLNAFQIDVTNCPDLVPVLVSLAVHCRGESRITGTARLRFKESDRVLVLKREFGRLGARITISEDEIRISGGSLRGGAVSAAGDHRIAMALGVAALNGKGGVEIDDISSVDKSYPGFFEDLAQIGARIE